MLFKVMPRRAFFRNVARRRDVIGRHRIAQQRQYARATNIAQAAWREQARHAVHAKFFQTAQTVKGYFAL